MRLRRWRYGYRFSEGSWGGGSAGSYYCHEEQDEGGEEMKKDYVLIFKTKEMTDREQVQMVMEARSVVSRIAPDTRTVVGIEKDERRDK